MHLVKSLLSKALLALAAVSFSATFVFAAPIEQQFELKGAYFSYLSNVPLSVANANIETAVFVIHGSERNAGTYFDTFDIATHQLQIEQKTLVIAPHFELKSDPDQQQKLAFSDEGWLSGNLALNSRTLGSFDVMDAMIRDIALSGKFPRLKLIIITGHSAGGQFTQRYALASQIETEISQIRVRYAPVNSGSYVYLNQKRSVPVDPKHCPNFNHYKYGLEQPNVYFQKTAPKVMIENYLKKNVTYFVGEKDTNTHGLDRTCAAEAQGENRFARANLFFKTLNKEFPSSTHTLLVVPEQGHTERGMYLTDLMLRTLFKKLNRALPAQYSIDGVDHEFSTKGAIGFFKFESPSDRLNRTILYYLPKSITSYSDPTHPQKLMTFLHGGGSSTVTDSQSTKTAYNYIQDFIEYAEKNQVILVFPTTTIGWNGETRFFLRTLQNFIKSKFLIQADQNILAGHSMGAMGITREYPYITDVFSGILALAGGTQDTMLNDELMTPYLNGTPYTHLNGNQDAFDIFKPRMLVVEKRVIEMENQSGLKSNFKLLFHDGGHAYHLAKTYHELDLLFQQPSHAFPKFFQAPIGVFRSTTHAVIDQAFWIQTSNYQMQPSEGKDSSFWLTTKVTGQKITIQTIRNELKPKTYTFKLSESLLNLNLPVEISIDGVSTIFSALPARNSDGTVTLSVTDSMPISRAQ